MYRIKTKTNKNIAVSDINKFITPNNWVEVTNTQFLTSEALTNNKDILIYEQFDDTRDQLDLLPVGIKDDIVDDDSTWSSQKINEEIIEHVTHTDTGDTIINVTYSNVNPTPTTIGGVIAGSTFNKQTIQQMFDMILYPYQAPSFSSFQINGQNTTLEVGDSIKANPTFAWTITNSNNIQQNSIKITDSSSNVLINNCANDGLETITQLSIQKITNTSYSFTIQATNTQNNIFNKTFSVNWQWKRYYGESANASLIENDIKNLRVNGLASGFAGTYNFNGGGYKYIVYPTAFGTATIFKDQSTNLSVPFEAPYTINITNSFGITTQYRIHRTTNIIGGSMNIVVS